LKSLFKDVFNFDTTIKYIEARRTYYTISNNKQIVDWFLQFHSAGISKTLNCDVPNSIFNSDDMSNYII
jgi:hypothetical protein